MTEATVAHAAAWLPSLTKHEQWRTVLCKPGMQLRTVHARQQALICYCFLYAATCCMQDFFCSLPEEVSSHLQALPCIPTEADDGSVGAWVPPGNALVCTSPHINALVSAEQLARLQGKFFVHPSLTVLHEPRSPLRKLLHIREFDPQEVRCVCVYVCGLM